MHLIWTHVIQNNDIIVGQRMSLCSDHLFKSFRMTGSHLERNKCTVFFISFFKDVSQFIFVLAKSFDRIGISSNATIVSSCEADFGRAVYKTKLWNLHPREGLLEDILNRARCLIKVIELWVQAIKEC